MDNFPPIEPPRTTKSRGWMPTGLLFTGLFAAACTTAAYYSNRLTKRSALILGSISTIAIACGTRLFFTPGRIKPIKSKPFFDRAAFEQLLQDPGYYPPGEVSIGNMSLGLGDQLVGFRRTATQEEYKPAIDEWENSLQYARAVCKEFNLDQLLVPASEVVQATAGPDETIWYLAQAGIQPGAEGKLGDLPNLKKTIYQLAIFIVQTGWSEVTHETLRFQDNKVTLNFICRREGAEQGLCGGSSRDTGLLNLIPPSIAKQLALLLPNSLREKCRQRLAL